MHWDAGLAQCSRTKAMFMSMSGGPADKLPRPRNMMQQPCLKRACQSSAAQIKRPSIITSASKGPITSHTSPVEQAAAMTDKVRQSWPAKAAAMTDKMRQSWPA